MLEQILYDKIISVTLYRKEMKPSATYKTVKPSTYTDEKVNNRTVIGVSAATQISQTKNVGTNYEQKGVIEFYQGNYRDILVDTVRVKGQYVDKYKRVYAHGPTFTFATLEDMKKGVRPDGSPFQSGDRIRVVEDGSRWNVYTEGDISSAYTETEVIVPTSALEIACTDSGMKPDLSLSINLLPGQNCYGATLKIKNFNMDPIDIRTWQKMVITAGYRTGKKVIYNCPIYSSYLESPNPDGIIVFEGLTVGVAEDVLTDRYITVDFRQEEMTLAALIRDVAQGIAENINVNIALDDEYAQALVSITKQKVYAQNGMAILNWLQTFVSEFLFSYTEGETTAFVQLVDNRLDVMAVNGKNKTPLLLENVVNLDMVSGASFAGTALTVTAPWNPALRPGDLFFMPPQFINGAKLPNSINVSDYRNDKNLYRAITISIEFATVESTNKMSILAVPAQWAGRLPSNKTTEMPADVYGEELTKMYRKANYEVPVGSLGKLPASQTSKAIQSEKTGKAFFDEHADEKLLWWDTWVTITQDTVTTGSCISKIAQYYLVSMEGGPRLAAGKMGNERQEFYNETRQYLSSRPKAIQHYQNKGIWSQMLWWPLIVLATYWRRKADIEHGYNHNWSRIKVDDPNFVEEGKAVLIPAFPNGTWEQNRTRFAQIKDIWKDAYITYKRERDYGDSCKVWRAMYYYLGGTDELD